MTEQEWLVCTDPQAMLKFVSIDRPATAGTQMASDRKLRLFACACLRAVWDRLPESGRITTVKSEDMAERCCWTRWADPAWVARTESGIATSLGMPQSAQADLLREVFGNPFRPVRQAVYDNPGCPNKQQRHPDQMCTCPPWLTPQVLALALAAYSERLETGRLDPFQLALLADALEENGCPIEIQTDCVCVEYKDDPDNPWGEVGYRPERDPASGRHEGGWSNCKMCNSGGNRNRAGVVIKPNPVLEHLRNGGVHVRGCHVLDVILEKS